MVAQVNEATFDAGEALDSGLVGGTPGEQAPAEAPAATPRPPAPIDVPTLQREYTQTRQRWSAVVGALGMDKDTPVDVITARLAELQNPRGEDDGPFDPEAAKRNRALEAREWEVETRLHGDLALHARKLIDKVRSHPNMSPSDATDAFYEAVEAAVVARMAAGPFEAPEAPAPTQPTFGQEAPITPRTPGGIDTAGLTDLSDKERDEVATGWLQKQLSKFGV